MELGPAGADTEVNGSVQPRGGTVGEYEAI